MVWLESLRLSSGRVPARIKAVENLAGEKHPRAVQLLLKTLSDPDAAVRHAAAEAIGNLRSEEFFDALVAALGDPSADVRAVAVTALGRLEDRRAIDPLLKCLRDPEARVRVFALAALSSLGWKKPGEASSSGSSEASRPIDAQALLAGLEEPVPVVRRSSAHALEKLGDPDHSGWFLPLLGDPDFEIRAAAARYFGRMKDPYFAQSVLPLLNDQDSDVREAAAAALGELRNPEAIDALVLAMADEESAVRQAAEAALRNMDPSWAKLDAVHKASLRLKPLLNDPRPWVSAAAAQLLTKIHAARMSGAGPSAQPAQASAALNR